MSDDRESDRNEVRHAAHRLLGRRAHAREELARKLEERDFDPDLIREVLDDCVEAGYVDDEEFARDQGSMLARKSWGPHKIRAKLTRRGVDGAIVDRALEKLGEEYDWEQQALSKLRSKFGDPAELDDRDQQRAYRHLMHRGFGSGLIRRLLFDRPD